MLDPTFEKDKIVFVGEASNWESIPRSSCSLEELFEYGTFSY